MQPNINKSTFWVTPMSSQGWETPAYNSLLIISIFPYEKKYTTVTHIIPCPSQYWYITLSLRSLIWPWEGGREERKGRWGVLSLSWGQVLIDLQIKTEDDPGLWGVTGMEVCCGTPPGPCTYSTGTKARPEMALWRPSEGNCRPKGRWKQW